MTNVDGKRNDVSAAICIDHDFVNSIDCNVDKSGRVKICTLKHTVDINKHNVDSIVTISVYGLVDNSYWYANSTRDRLGDLIMRQRSVIDVNFKIFGSSYFINV